MYISNRAAVYQKKELESERNNDIKQEAVQINDDSVPVS